MASSSTASLAPDIAVRTSSPSPSRSSDGSVPELSSSGTSPCSPSPGSIRSSGNGCSDSEPTVDREEALLKAVRPVAHRSYSPRSDQQQQPSPSETVAPQQDSKYATEHPSQGSQTILPADTGMGSFYSTSRPAMMPHMDSSTTLHPSAHEGSAACTPSASPIGDPVDRNIIARLESELEPPDVSSCDAEGWAAHEAASRPLATESHGVGTHARQQRLHASGNSLASHALSDEARSSGVASPDSWRSLLPEHDPFYASNAELASGAPRSRVSSANSPFDSETGLRQTRDLLLDSTASSRKASLSSHRGSYSSITSLLSNTAVAGTSSGGGKPRRKSTRDSWRSLLPDDDPAAVGLSSPEDEDEEPASLSQSRLSYQGSSSISSSDRAGSRRPNSFSTFKDRNVPEFAIFRSSADAQQRGSGLGEGSRAASAG